MGTKVLLLILTLFFSEILSAGKNDVLIAIGDHKISKEEFERIYKKNNQSLANDSDITSPEEYLEMYINFKLKVIDALNMKMDTLKSFREELAGYRTELAAPYLTDMKYDEAYVKELYERMTTELDASHILFMLDPDANEEQEQMVLEKAFRVRAEVLNGMDFNEAARKYSQDPSAPSNHGHLGYFSAFQMVTPFENVAYKTPVGQVSEPVRTAFGYHLIKVHDIRQNQGELKVAHIMKNFPQESTYDKKEHKAEMDKIYDLLQQGADFGGLALQYSDDKNSASQNGELPWFTAGQMIPEFSKPAFEIEHTGDFTPPLETPYGFHIIKKLGHRPVPPFEEIRDEIEARIKKDPDRSSSTRKVFVEKLKDQYGYREWAENCGRIKSMDTDSIPNDNPVLFTIDSKNFTFDHFQKYLQGKNTSGETYAKYFNDWQEYEIIALEDSRLEEKYPEFRYLMQEYHDGLLFFNIMEEKIWKYAADDTTGLENFYKNNKNKFYWDERFKGLVITCESPEIRAEAEKYFEAQLSAEEIEDILNHKENSLQIVEGIWEKGENKAVDYYVWSARSTSGFDPELTFLRGEIISPSPKTLEEAKGLYISSYQEFLDRKWIESLRKQHKIKVKKRILKKIPHA